MAEAMDSTIDVPDPSNKVTSESTVETKPDGDDASTKATEENDSDSTIVSTDVKKESNSDDDADDSGSTKEDDTRTQEEKDKEAKEKEEAEKKRIEELKIKYKDWPLKNIKEPHENDVMYGRGGGTNHHPGNKQYRKMVENRKVKYVNSKRLDKPLVALEIIREWRAQWPPGRFLKHNDKTGNWDDVGDKKAREKTSQALREKAPQIRKQQEEELNGGEETDKTTRFAEGTKGGKKQNGKLKKAILARDHSLGREYLGSDEKVDLQGFTWQDPFKKEGSKESSMSSVVSSTVLPPGKESSMGSLSSWGFSRNPQPPSIPDYYGRVNLTEQRREFSNSSFGSLNPPYLPPPPGGPFHQRSGSWTHPPPPAHGAHHQRSGSWNGGGREHSLSINPLDNTSINRPAPMGAFEQRGSGYWGGGHAYPTGPQGSPYPPQPPPPGPYGGFAYHSGSSMGTIGSVGPTQHGPYRQGHSPTSPPYDVMGVARTWSGGGAPPPPGNFGPSQYDDRSQPVPGTNRSPPRGFESNPGRLPRPAMVKRDTSNQNETYETKPTRIKKAALNRDQSATSNRLKEKYIPEVFNRDLQSIQKDTEQIRLSSPVPEKSNTVPKPTKLDLGARQSTVDAMQEAMTELFDGPPPQPAALSGADRANTIDELGGYDLIGDSDSKLPPTRPPKLTQADRLTTTEFNNIMNAPFPQLNDKTDDASPLPM